MTPLTASCEADGLETGPLDIFMTAPPSNYCVRVQRAGFVSNLALRMAPGYFVTDYFAISIPIRIQFSAGESSS